MKGDIETAIRLCVEAHRGQKDKAGEPYVLHPLRIMMKFHREELRIVAVLHDVIEDTDLTREDLEGYGFGSDVLDAIECLTKREGVPYAEYLRGVRANSLARSVKIEDLRDNMDLSRLDEISEEDFMRYGKYHGALKFLSETKQ